MRTRREGNDLGTVARWAASDRATGQDEDHPLPDRGWPRGQKPPEGNEDEEGLL